LVAAERGERARTKLMPFVGEYPQTANGRAGEPHPHRHAGPSCEPRRDDEFQQREHQYNGQDHETHGSSLHDHPAIVVFTNVPDNATATARAQALLDERLAACVNIGPPIDSMYHWRGAI